MKYLVLFSIVIISCKSNNVTVNKSIDKTSVINQQNDYSKLLSSNNSYTLYFKVEKGVSGPVKIFTYYVTNTSTKKTVKSSQQIAAEKIYWKDDHTLAIIPYTEMVQKQSDVYEPEKSNEILINIK